MFVQYSQTAAVGISILNDRFMYFILILVNATVILNVRVNLFGTEMYLSVVICRKEPRLNKQQIVK